jgi:hypothetical protein
MTSPRPIEIIQDFLTVPGIAGIAMMDGSTIPRLYSADPTLQIQHPKTFLASVTPILRTLASEVQQLEFFFGTYRLYVNRLGYGFTVAVLTHQSIDWHNNSQNLQTFCETVQANLKISIPILETWASARNNLLPPHSPTPDLQTYLNAFNHLTQIAAQTLGNTIITSQLNRSRPGSLTIAIDIAKTQLTAPNQPLNPNQLKVLHQWTQDFRNQCSKIIRDFDTTARQAGLTSEEATLLFGE